MRSGILEIGLSLGLVAGCGPRHPGVAQETSTTDSAGESSASATTSESGEAETGTATATETATGTETGTETQTETETSAPACDNTALLECTQAVDAAGLECQSACADGFSCAGRFCQSGCLATYFPARHDCYETHCPAYLEPVWLDIGDCYFAAQTCASSPACDLHACGYMLYDCLWMFGDLLDLELEFTWMGSCEVMLPGPAVFPELSTWWSGNYAGDVEPIGTDCFNGNAATAHWLGDLYDRVELCPDACVEFVNTGTLVFGYGVPAP